MAISGEKALMASISETHFAKAVDA